MNFIPNEKIEKSILLIRGHKVMLDSVLAEIYGVTTKRLNEQVKRNVDRFPIDFMFQLTENEGNLLRSQIATSNENKGGRRYLPYVFTEHGVVMLASVLNSPIAVSASVQVVRVFINLRQLLSSHVAISRKLEALEKNYDSQFKAVFEVIRKLMVPVESNKRRIGIITDDE